MAEKKSAAMVIPNFRICCSGPASLERLNRVFEKVV